MHDIITCTTMAEPDLYQKLDRTNEIELTVKGRKSGIDIPGPYGLYVKARLYICFQSMAPTQTGTKTC